MKKLFLGFNWNHEYKTVNCHQCDAKIQRNANLGTSRPYTCFDCKTKNKNRYAMKYYINKTHEVPTLPSTGE